MDYFEEIVEIWDALGETVAGEVVPYIIKNHIEFADGKPLEV